MQFKLVKILKKSLVFFLSLILICICLFVSFNKPKIVKADVLSAVIFGGSALSAIVGAYFATSGVSLSGNGDVSGNFLGNYIANWVQNSSSFPNNGYFNENGEYIGSQDQLSIVQNKDTDAVSIIFGKEFAIWLEALKQLFVSDNNLEVGETVVLDETVRITYDDSIYPVTINNNDSFSFPNDVDKKLFTTVAFDYSQPFNFTFDLSEDISIILEYTGYRQRTYLGFYNKATNSYITHPMLNNGNAVSSPVNLVLWLNENTNYLACFAYYSGNVSAGGASINLNTYTIDGLSNMSLEGALTDGYEDFEEAINQDLDNDNEDLVIGTNVGVFPDVLNPDQIADMILDRIAIGELNPEYDGTFENQKEAEEEYDNEKEFVPEVPEGWVTVEGLQSFFPFCIPWDLYSLILELNVPPKAPKFNWKIDLSETPLNLEYDTEIDLSAFETAAQIFRIFIVIGFVLLLVWKTRDMIRG